MDSCRKMQPRPPLTSNEDHHHGEAVALSAGMGLVVPLNPMQGQAVWGVGRGHRQLLLLYLFYWNRARTLATMVAKMAFIVAGCIQNNTN